MVGFFEARRRRDRLVRIRGARAVTYGVERPEHVTRKICGFLEHGFGDVARLFVARNLRDCFEIDEFVQQKTEVAQGCFIGAHDGNNSRDGERFPAASAERRCNIAAAAGYPRGDCWVSHPRRVAYAR